MKLSIVTICRNNAKGLVRTLESTFVGQSEVNDWEQIIVDGASTDGSFAAVEKWRNDPRLGWTVSEPDKGIYQAMNKGAAHARGDWLLFLNAGDILLPGVLGRFFNAGVLDGDVVYGDIVRILNGLSYPFEVAEGNQIRPEYFLFTTLPHQACFIARSLHEKIGGYDESFRIISDWKFFLEASRDPHVRFRHVPLVMAKFELGGASTAAEFAIAKAREFEEILRPVFGPAVAHRAAFPSENKPWIRGPVADAALHNPSLARCLRRSNDMVATMWKLLPTRLLLRALTSAADLFVLTGKRLRRTHSEPEDS